MSQTITVSAGKQQSPLISADVGSLVTLTPTGTAYVEYTTSSLADARNGTATWVTWPNGSVTAASSDTTYYPLVLRVQVTSGTATLQVDDPVTQVGKDIAKPWKSRDPKFIADISGNVSGLYVQEGKTAPLPVKSGPKIAILGNSIVAQGAGLDNANSWTSWASSTAFATNANVFPKVHDLSGGVNAIKWIATTGGTTGTTEPAWKWSDPVGTTYTDGTVVWTAQADTSSPWCCWANGYFTMAQQLSGQLLDEVCIIGRSGEQSSTILPYLDRALATSPDVVAFFNMFENDCWPGAAPTLATIATNWNTFVTAADRVRGMGKRVMVSTVLPNGNIDASSLFTSYSAGNGTKAWMWLNNKIREFARARPDVILWDCANVYVDPNPANPVWPENSTTFTSVSGSGQQLKFTDGVHPYINAGWRLGKSLATILTANFPARTIFNPSGDTWQKAVNPLMYGTGGTKDASLLAGTVPDSLTGYAYSSTSSTGSSVARTDIPLANFAQIAASASAAANGDVVQVAWTATQAISPFAVGDVAQTFAEMSITSGPTLFVYPSVWTDFSGASSSRVMSVRQPNTAQDAAASFVSTYAGGQVLTMKTPPYIIPTGTTAFMVYNRAFWRGAATVTAQFGRMAVRFVTQKTTPV